MVTQDLGGGEGYSCYDNKQTLFLMDKHILQVNGACVPLCWLRSRHTWYTHAATIVEIKNITVPARYPQTRPASVPSDTYTHTNTSFAGGASIVGWLTTFPSQGTWQAWW